VLAGCSRGDLEQQGDLVRGLQELGSGGAMQQEGVEGGGHVEAIYAGGLFPPVACVAALIGVE